MIPPYDLDPSPRSHEFHDLDSLIEIFMNIINMHLFFSLLLWENKGGFSKI